MPEGEAVGSKFLLVVESGRIKEDLQITSAVFSINVFPFCYNSEVTKMIWPDVTVIRRFEISAL